MIGDLYSYFIISVKENKHYFEDVIELKKKKQSDYSRQ